MLTPEINRLGHSSSGENDQTHPKFVRRIFLLYVMFFFCKESKEEKLSQKSDRKDREVVITEPPSTFDPQNGNGHIF